MRWNPRTWLVLVLVCVLPGCASLGTIMYHRTGSSDPLVYGGTRQWFRTFTGNDGGEAWGKARLAMALFPPLMLIPVFDTPLSFVADTVLLPVSLPWAVSEELSNATVADRFSERIKHIHRKCSKRRLDLNELCGPVAHLKPFDALATEEGRFAASVILPNQVSADSGFNPGMSSHEYFEHLCNTEAGEFIFKAIDTVDGVFQMRPRPSPSFDAGHLYAPEDPYGLSQVDGLSPEYLGGPSKFSFVEAIAVSDKKHVPQVGQSHNVHDNAKYVRYRIDFQGSTWAMKPTEVDSKLKSRYGYTWRGIKRPHDRELGIAGSEVIVLDLVTQEVLGVYRAYARFDFTKQRYDDLGMGWVGRCPNPSNQSGSLLQREFLYKVLHP